MTQEDAIAQLEQLFAELEPDQNYTGAEVREMIIARFTQLLPEIAEPLDDPEYRAWLLQCASNCSCCSRCWESPCSGVLAGGMCDMITCQCEEIELEQSDDSDGDGVWF